MLKISPEALVEIAVKNDWIHKSGRLKGTVNASRMAAGLGVTTSTVTRAYDTGSTGLVLVEKLHDVSGISLDRLLVKADDEEQRSPQYERLAA